MREVCAHPWLRVIQCCAAIGSGNICTAFALSFGHKSAPIRFVTRSAWQIDLGGRGNCFRVEDDAQKSSEDFVKQTNASNEEKSKAIVNKSKDREAKSDGDFSRSYEDKEAVMLELEQLSNCNVELHPSCDFVMKNFKIRQNVATRREVLKPAPRRSCLVPLPVSEENYCRAVFVVQQIVKIRVPLSCVCLLTTCMSFGFESVCICAFDFRWHVTVTHVILCQCTTSSRCVVLNIGCFCLCEALCKSTFNLFFV